MVTSVGLKARHPGVALMLVVTCHKSELEKAMKLVAHISRCLITATVGLAACLSAAPAQSMDSANAISDNRAMYIEGRTGRIAAGSPKSDASRSSGIFSARELGPVTIVFRKNARLHMADRPSPVDAASRGMDAAQPHASTGGHAKSEVNRIRIAYEPPKNPAHQKLYQTIKERQVLEKIQQMLAPFRLPVELTIKTMGCDGQANSWFNFDDPNESIPTVHMCYELLQEVVDTRPNEQTPLLGITPHDALVGQFLFWTMHEVGHAVYHLFQVPLFGREEDAADEFSTYLMLQFGKDQAHRWVEGAAYTAHDLVKNYKENPAVERRLEKFSSTHGLPEQRFYNGLCLAYGADPELFADLVDSGLLPKTRAHNCDREYQTFDHAFKNQIMPHIDRAMAQAVFHKVWFPEPATPPAVMAEQQAAK
jgi:hypothetical protein